MAQQSTYGASAPRRTVGSKRMSHVGLAFVAFSCCVAQSLAAECTPRPFTIYPVFQLGSASDSERRYLEDKLIPTVQAVLGQTIQVKNRECGNLQLSPVKCVKEAGGVCVDSGFASEPATIPEDLKAPGYGHEGGPGVDADFVLFVSRMKPELCGGYWAFARTVTQDWKTNRPTSGVIEFCNFGEYKFESDIDLAIHEIFHALVMNPKFFMPEQTFWPPTGGPRWGSFIDETGRELTRSEILKEDIVDGQTVYKIITPRVLDFVRNFFHCPDADGAELEDDGGDATAVWHWDKRLFNGDIMQGLANAETFGGRSRMSRLTLALMEDSGWYNVNYRQREVNIWGQNARCEFLKTRCKRDASGLRIMHQQPTSRFFCDMQAQAGAGVMCTSDYSGSGLCTTETIGQWPFNAKPIMDGCDYVPASISNDCVSLGTHMRCMPLYDTMLKLKSAGCYKMTCKTDMLYFVVNGKEYRCPSGEMVDVPEIHTQFGPCPTNSLMCGTTIPRRGWLECPTDCSGKGVCIRGICQCFSGRAGADCSKLVCLNDKQCEAGQSCINGVCN